MADSNILIKMVKFYRKGILSTVYAKNGLMKRAISCIILLIKVKRFRQLYQRSFSAGKVAEDVDCCILITILTVFATNNYERIVNERNFQKNCIVKNDLNLGYQYTRMVLDLFKTHKKRFRDL